MVGRIFPDGLASAQNTEMNDWLPIADLKPGHYAVAQCHDGHEVDIYRAGSAVLNVATGQPITEVTGWRRRIFEPSLNHA